ncbi:MAG: ornithine carbamoyltransferase [Planctomycetota bacterium]
MRHLVTLFDISAEELGTIFALTKDLKSKFKQGVREPLLPGRVMALMFEKPSLRTRVSFQSGMAHLGGTSMMLGDDVGFGKRERVDDFTRVLSELVDVIVVRSKQHATVESIAEHATCAVINGLTDLAHPCQALADLYTVHERFGDLSETKIAWIGDGNNVARSLPIGCALMGARLSVASPAGYRFDEGFLRLLAARFPDWKPEVTENPAQAVDGASAVYTDVWASMGQEKEQQQRKQDFAAFQVNEALMASAPDDAVFMHCLPARRGEEVTDGVMDSPGSVIVEQAANRMHVQKGVLTWLLGAKG